MPPKTEEQPATLATPTTTPSTPAPAAPATVATTTATPVATTTTQAYSAWPPGYPALQQQSQHATTSAYPHYSYASHYPQAAYATHYQAYAPQTAQALARQASSPVTAYQSSYSLNSTATTAATTTATTSATTTAAASTTAAATNSVDTSDISTLNDALGSAGVDLKAEEESLQRQHDTHTSAYRSYEDRTRKQPHKPNFDTRYLGATMRATGTNHKVTRIPEESVNYLALALRARLQDLVTAMIAAAHHRNDTQFDRPASFYEEDGKTPMWSIVMKSDVAKQLIALEKAEREEEMKIRKERKERAEMTAAHTAALAAQANGMAGITGTGMGDGSGAGGDDMAEGGTAKKKRKKDGPGVTARNMSEDVRKKMSNAVATQAAGLGKYSWMTAANASAPPPKPKPAATSTSATNAGTASAPGTPSASGTSATTGGAGGGSGSSWARPYVPTKKGGTPGQGDSKTEDDNRTTVTMRDAMFVVAKERGHGGGRGAARGWV